jgi:hypothetical protein
MHVERIGWEGVDWIYLAHDRESWWNFVDVVMNIQVSSNVENILAMCATTGFSIRTLLREVSQLARMAFCYIL